MSDFASLYRRHANGGVLHDSGNFPCEHAVAAALLIARNPNTPGWSTATTMRETARAGACRLAPPRAPHGRQPNYPSGGAQSTVNELAREIESYHGGAFVGTALPPAYAPIEEHMRAAQAGAPTFAGFAPPMPQLDRDNSWTLFAPQPAADLAFTEMPMEEAVKAFIQIEFPDDPMQETVDLGAVLTMVGQDDHFGNRLLGFIDADTAALEQRHATFDGQLDLQAEIEGQIDVRHSLRQGLLDGGIQGPRYRGRGGSRRGLAAADGQEAAKAAAAKKKAAELPLLRLLQSMLREHPELLPRPRAATGRCARLASAERDALDLGGATGGPAALVA